MGSNKLLFKDIEVVSLEEGSHIPTALYYTSETEFLYGVEAASASSEVHDLNMEFKMALGNLVENKKNRTQHRTNASGVYKDAQELTRDFLGGIINEAINIVPSEKSNTTVLMAEPIAIEGDLVKRGWLTRYRKYIGEVLDDHGFGDVQFLSEPFAVYQYYRYGIQHHSLRDARTYDALVLDFGAGTLDTCVINTTKDGQISGGGRNSRPLGASAARVGGYFINEELAIETYLRYYKAHDPSNRQQFIDYLKTYRNRRSGKITGRVDDSRETFIENMNNVIYNIENAKIALSSQITDWSLDADLRIRVPIRLLDKPWSKENDTFQTYVTASDLKRIFIDKIWKRYVKQTILDTVQRSRKALEGRQIDIVLLSGGTCNLKWLPELINDELRRDIEYAQILTLPDYREVVAKGLAIECARQFYTDSNEGDFAETSYNALNLLLDSKDEGAFDVKPFIAQNSQLDSISDKPGTLIPSATKISNLTDKNLRWKVKLNSRPNTRLDYLFLKSSLDPSETKSWLNVQELFIDTPREFREGGWDSYTTIDLKIKKKIGVSLHTQHLSIRRKTIT